MSTESPVSFARGLSDPLQVNRLRALKSLSAWMDRCGSVYEFSPTEIDQVWRALQLTLWMADKRPVQQQVAAECVLFVRKIHGRYLVEWNRGFWYNIERMYETVDKYRVPKVHLLIRIYLSEMFHQMNERGFELSFVESLVSAITSNLHKAVGAYIQVISVYLDELHNEIGEVKFTEAVGSESAAIALIQPALHVVGLAGQVPLSLVSRTVEKFLVDPRIVNYSSTVRETIKTAVRTAAMSKKLEQDVRDVLYACIDQIDAIPQLPKVAKEASGEKRKVLEKAEKVLGKEALAKKLVRKAL